MGSKSEADGNPYGGRGFSDKMASPRILRQVVQADVKANPPNIKLSQKFHIFGQ